MIPTSSFYVLRHSERLDETDSKAWEKLIHKTYPTDNNNSKPISSIHTATLSSTNKHPSSTSSTIKKPLTHSNPSLPLRAKIYFTQDPPLSSNGLLIANNAANTLYQMITATTSTTSSTSSSSSSSTISIRLFCSKLQRAIQTAIPIAKLFHIPIYLSAGLATVISSVHKTHGKFEFLTIDELQTRYPDIEFIDCDQSNDPKIQLSSKHWIETIHQINQPIRNTINIIVGHRETIRGLAGEHVETPYCAIGIFENNALDESNPKKSSTSMTHNNQKQRDGPLYPLLIIYDSIGNIVLQRS